MLSVKDAAVVYETLLASPGMNDTVKISLQIPRKHILLLSKVIELGIEMRVDENKGGLLKSIDADTMQEIAGLSSDLLRKAGLTEMNEKMNTLLSKEK